MSMLDGVSQCWWLSETCAVNWSAWATIATVMAGTIALYVGLVPMVIARKQRARIGRAEARVAASDLRLQALHLAAGLKMLEHSRTPSHIYRVATAQFLVLDVESCRKVLPYLDVLPEELEGPLSSAISDIGTGVRVLNRLEIEDGERQYDATGPRVLYSTLLGSIEIAREALWTAIGDEGPLEALEPGASELAEILRAKARADLVSYLTSATQVR